MTEKTPILRLKFIVCKVMQREAYFCAARSRNIVDITLVPQGLHETPNLLRDELQKEISSITDLQQNTYDAILLGYGLCSNGILGISSKVPIVVPRGHDCITLLLGSKERYRQYFDSHPGIYWYSPGWIETGEQPSQERYEKLLIEYEEKYGPENAKYLIETEQGWISNYSWATYIDWDLPSTDEHKDFTKECADFLGWNYDQIKGDPSLMQRLVDGHWDQNDFLTVKPGQKIAEDLTNPGIIKTEE